MRRAVRHTLAARIALPFAAAALALGITALIGALALGADGYGLSGGTLLGVMAGWTLLSAVLFGALGIAVARGISSSLRPVAAGARRVAEGDYGARIDVPDIAEIAELAHGLNQMTAALDERSGTLTKRMLELTTLHETSRTIGSTLELDTLLQGALGAALRLFEVEAGYVVLRADGGGELQMCASRGPVPDRPDAELLAASMAQWVVRESRPLIFNPSRDGNGGDRVDPVTGASAALSVPLTSSEGTVGALTVGTSAPAHRFGGDDVRLLSTIANHVTTAIGTVELFNSLHDAYLATVRSLAAAVDAKDPYTRGHSDRVALYAALAAEQMGLTHEQRMALEMSAYLHDIGKIGIPERILLKPGRLDDEEMTEMRHHPIIGAGILEPVSFPWPITPVVRHHHEWWDGSGYPAGLEGTRIPLLARILAVADAYEAMIADRPYRSGRCRQEGLAELESCAGTQFDPDVVTAFAAALLDHPDADAWVAGTGNGRYGVPDAPRYPC